MNLREVIIIVCMLLLITSLISISVGFFLGTLNSPNTSISQLCTELVSAQQRNAELINSKCDDLVKRAKVCDDFLYKTQVLTSALDANGGKGGPSPKN
jgi:hypothetical protein